MSEETSMQETQDRLYAGKFKTVEELEKGYRESLPVHIKNKELEERLSKIGSVPNEYMVPVGIELSQDKVREIQHISKEAGMNQDQFSNAVKAASIEYHEKMTRLEERKAEIGEQKVNMVKSYLDRNFNSFGEDVKNDLFLKTIENPATMEQIMNDRESQLNSTIPGTDRISISTNPQQSLEKEFKEACKISSGNPADAEARNRTIELANQLAEAKKSGRRYNNM